MCHIQVCLIHIKIRSLIEIRIMWWKSWKFLCVGKFWYDEKVKSLKKKLGTKPSPNPRFIYFEIESGTTADPDDNHSAGVDLE